MVFIKKFGKCGCLLLFYGGTLITSLPLSKKKTLEYYFKESEKCLLVTMNQNKLPIKNMVKVLKEYLDTFRYRRIHSMKVSTNDNYYFALTFLLLVRLKRIEMNSFNGYMVITKKQNPYKNPYRIEAIV
jgi:hypothetical protein